VKLNIEISKDDRKAFLSVTAGADDEKFDVTPEEIVSALGNMGVTEGIKHDILAHICHKKQCNKSFLVAEAIPPQRGEDAKIVIKKKPKKRSTYDTGVDADKKVDHFGEREGFITHIQKDEVIASRIPPGKGKSGFTVRGDPIEGLPGKEISWQTVRGRNTRFDGNNLVATADGCLRRIDHVFHVDPVIEIDGDLGIRTGSINLPLEADIELIVGGDIKSGFTAQCRKIVVMGMVEDSRVTAKTLEVKGGIVGTGSAPITADYLEAGFITGTRKIISKYVAVAREISGGTQIETNFLRAMVIQECRIRALYGIWTKYLLGHNDIILGIDIHENEEFKVWSQKLKEVDAFLAKVKTSNQSLLKKADVVREMVQRNPNNPALKKEHEKIVQVTDQIHKTETVKKALEKKLQAHSDKMYVDGGSFLLVELGFVKQSPGAANSKPVNNITIKEYSFDKKRPLITGLYTVVGEEVLPKPKYSLPDIEKLAENCMENALK